MAFVFKSDRKTVIGEKASTELGPGQYLSSESLIFKNKPNSSKAPPFLTSAKRVTSSVKKDQIPGPGTYQLIDNYLASPSQINSVFSKKTDTLYNNFDLNELSGSEPLGFLQKDRRFHYEAKDDIPGPGQYESVLLLRKASSTVSK